MPPPPHLSGLNTGVYGDLHWIVPGRITIKNYARYSEWLLNRKRCQPFPLKISVKNRPRFRSCYFFPSERCSCLGYFLFIHFNYFLSILSSIRVSVFESSKPSGNNNLGQTIDTYIYILSSCFNDSKFFIFIFIVLTLTNCWSYFIIGISNTNVRNSHHGRWNYQCYRCQTEINPIIT